jgi:hypothetical protein
MAHFIHTRNTPEGIRFRLWTDSSDEYYTEELTEAELREYLLKEAVCAAIEEHLRTIDDRVERASEHGTSSLMGDTRDIIGPWDKSREELDREEDENEEDGDGTIPFENGMV